MSELYWLGVLGKLHSFGVCIVGLSVLVMLFWAFILVTTTLDGYDKPPI